MSSNKSPAYGRLKTFLSNVIEQVQNLVKERVTRSAQLPSWEKGKISWDLEPGRQSHRSTGSSVIYQTV